MDLLFGVLKKIMGVRLDLHVVISCATLDALHLKRYFEGYTVGIVCVGGHVSSMYPSEVYFRKRAVQNYVRAAVQTAVCIHCKEPAYNGHILVFLCLLVSVILTLLCIIDVVIQTS